MISQNIELLFEERYDLLLKKDKTGLTQVESKRLLYIEWIIELRKTQPEDTEVKDYEQWANFNEKLQSFISELNTRRE